MNPSRSEFVSVRGLRYHVRRWGSVDAPMLFLCHGWMDVSATFAPVAERLSPHLQVLAPDWRGFGESEWPEDGYWFADYVGDLDALAEHYSPGRPILLAGHSMGATAVCHFAGLRPDRVAKLAVLDGLALPNGDSRNIVSAYRRWLDALQNPPETPSYRSFEELAGRVHKRHPHLDVERCLFIAHCWGKLEEDGRVRLQADPRHMLNMPRTYLQADSDAIWAGVTAETLFIDGGISVFRKTLPADEIARRRALFRNHREVEIDNAGHMLHFEAPEALAARLKEFFAG